MIIDEKGRLFGLINVFDLFVLAALLVILYLGSAALIAVRQTKVEIVSVTPDNVLFGQNPEIDVQIKNTKFIVVCQVRLIPVDFQGETYQYSGELHLAARDHIYFKTMPSMAPGRYRVELELTLQDNFRRTSVVLVQPEDKILTLAEPQATEEREKYWQIEAQALVSASVASKLKPEAEYRDSSGRFSAQVERLVPVNLSEAKQLIVNYMPHGAASLASLKFYVPFSGLGDLQRSLAQGSRIVLETPAGPAEVWMTGQGTLKPQLASNQLFWEMDFLLLVYTTEQRAAIKAGARQSDDKDRVMAEVLQVLGEEPTAWILTAPDGSRSPSNLRVRLRLLCELKNGRLSWGGQSLEPNSILRFEFAGQEVYGNALGPGNAGDKLSLNLLFTIVENRFADNLQPGAALLDPASRKQVGQITAILDRAPAEVPTAGFGSMGASTEIGKRYQRILARAELFYQMRGGSLYAGDQLIDPKTNLSFSLFSETLPVRIWQNETITLPKSAADQTVWITARVQFGPVETGIAALVSPGLQDTNDMLNVDLELEKVLSDKPSQVMFVGQNGISSFDSPTSRNLTCSIRMKVVKNGELCYFRGNRVIIGSPITFQASRFNLNGKIEDF